MKLYIKYLFGFLIIFNITSCDEGFDEINTNKINPTSLAPNLILNRAIINTTYLNGFSTQGEITYNMGIVQQVVTPYGSSLSGANYNQFNNSNSSLIWVNFYQNVVKQIVAVIDQTKDDPKQVNIYNQARIWKAYSFLILTDNYGDVPYFEAGTGYLNQVVAPKYDSQELIYKDILKELEEATKDLNITEAPIATDILYGGNVVSWKKFGYSLMLRAAMRMSKVDPVNAEVYVKKAVAGGLFVSNDDNCVIRHTSIYNNYIANQLSAREKTNFYLAQPFVNQLKSTNDPRLGVFAVRYVGAKSGSEQVKAKASYDPLVQVGMPIGYNDVTISSTFATNNVISLWDYSQINLTTFLKLDAKEFLVTYSQNQLLLAEAALRNWIIGDPEIYYNAGIRANLEQMALYDSNSAISESSISNYINSQKFEIAKGYEQINTQYWIATFLNGSESFANFRRSGFPVLSKNTYEGSELKTEDFIRRLPYPDSELTINSANLNEAIKRQGPNNLESRVWWDKK